jgi:competence protein ComEC
MCDPMKPAPPVMMIRMKLLGGTSRRRDVPHVNRAHLVPLALAFLAGIASDSWNVALPVLGVGLALASLARTVPGVVRANALAALALGILDARTLAHAPPANGDEHFRRFHAVVVDRVMIAPGSVQAALRLDDGSLATFVSPDPSLTLGERLLMRAKREAFDLARNPGEPSQRELESERGIAWRLARATVRARPPPDGRDPSLWIPRVRAWASERLHAVLPEPGATILAGAMWGERGALPPDLREEFQETGTVHVLVTAGLHLGVVAGLALTLLKGLRAGRAGSALGTIAIVWAYAAFSGAHLPSVRAATMLSFALLAYATGREAFSWNALAAAAIVVAATRPASVTSVSFGLSFSCVAAIFAFAPPLARAFARAGLPHLACETFAVTLATQLGTWPLTASAFLVLAPYAPLANAAVVPVVGVAMLAGFATLAATPVPPLAALFANLDVSLLDWIASVVRVVARLPGALLVATPPPPWTIATYDLALVAAAACIARERAWRAFALIAAGSALCLWPPRVPNHDLRVTAIDVGQADALLVQTPRGHAYLVDAGGRLERGPGLGGASTAEDVGTRIVAPFLIRSGIHHLDAIFLSHPHGDHAGGVAPVLRMLGANGFADSGQSYPGHAYHDALDVAREAHVPMLEPRGGDVWHTDDGVTFRFYGPTLPYITGSRSDINSNSLVFRLEYGRFRMLFMGDAGRETEERLLAVGDDLRADVLKVGHHGSAYGTTPEFLRAVEPSAAIISVGRNNLFGHPAPSTLEALRVAGVATYRTDRDGAVTLESDGTHVLARGFLSSAHSDAPGTAP